MDVTHFGQAVDTYVRPGTPPVAVRLLDSADEIPDRARMPLRDFGVKMPLCQGMALARRHGLVMAMGKDDMLCPLGAVAMGLLSAGEGFLDGRFGIPYWASSQEATAGLAQGMARLEYGRHTHVVVAPLERTAFEPQVLVVYGDPAQVGRMIQAVVYVTGQPCGVAQHRRHRVCGTDREDIAHQPVPGCHCGCRRTRTRTDAGSRDVTGPAGQHCGGVCRRLAGNSQAWRQVSNQVVSHIRCVYATQLRAADRVSQGRLSVARQLPAHGEVPAIDFPCCPRDCRTCRSVTNRACEQAPASACGT
ncbi:MAG: hypothetical protein E4G93_04820 [Dehalococcoidia bacterium]|nr:MAG: hypothetical protein E4G93_04820 [Dehalococcoidia bacterium]